MTKVSFIDPADHKHRQTFGSNFYSRPRYLQSTLPPDPSKVFLRKKPSLTSSRTDSRSLIRSTIKTLSEVYHSLSGSNLATWTTYKDHLSGVNSAYKAFIKINSQLLRPQSLGLSPLLSISSPPQNPAQPSCFASIFLTESASICVTWLNNYLLSTYIELWRFIPPGKVRFTSQPITFLCFAISTAEEISFSVQDQELYQLNQLFIRALNLRGEVSIFSPYDPVIKQTMRAGAYGYSSYGYAYYNS